MNTHVREVLNHKGWNTHSIAPDRTVYEAIERMNKLDIGALVVLEEGVLRGIITERDYMKKIALEGRSSQETPVAEIMTADVVCVDPAYTVRECMAVMTDVRCRHLPVTRDGLITGLISMGDCVHHVTRDLEYEVRHLKDYICRRYPG